MRLLISLPVLALLATVFPALSRAAPDRPVPYPNERMIQVSSGGEETIAGPALSQGQLYGILIYLPTLANLGEADGLAVTVADGNRASVTKTLHAGDPDMYLTFQPSSDGPLVITVGAARVSGEPKRYTLHYLVSPLGSAKTDGPLLAALPNSDWHRGQRFELGTTIYGSNDERPYIPQLAGAESMLAGLTAGAQWFTFRQAGPEAKLVHFVVDLLDRDVPADVALFTSTTTNGVEELLPYTQGIERYNTEQSTPFHGLQKFIARVVEPGTYYVRVMGNHPFYRLRTIVYDPPPYTEPAKAIRVGMDYLLRKGDSWHANTPRRGSVVLRTSNRMGETAQCIACHPTHFTTRAELVAIENGWPLRERPGLQFLTERLYNNPRPLYGDGGAVWARMISAPGNVLSRLAYMLVTFEKNVSDTPRGGLLDPIGTFLEQYWNGVESPITESNGNSPRVSGFEVALHSGIVFDELYRRTGDTKYRSFRRQVERVVANGTAIDTIDLCWKIVALCEFDRAGHSDQIAALVDELFSRQKTNGTWSVAFDRPLQNDALGRARTADAPKGPDGTPKESEFQTYHALYALAKAGVAPEDPRVSKSVAWCLSRQWPHGGWQGNSDFKNFDTVFRDTQFAVMALSQFYKGPGSHGWTAGLQPALTDLGGKDIPQLLDRLDQHWTRPAPEVLEQARTLLRHQQPMVRLAAAAMLGRVGDAESVPSLVQALGDGSKLVQRSAAWALRQITSKTGAGKPEILAALESGDDRTRSGALRIFNQHFKYFTDDWRLGEALISRLQVDPVPANRVEAAQALWQWWFWDGNPAHQAAIEDLFIGELAVDQHPWTRRNLVEGLHNLLDDNVRYLNNDWIPSLKADTDRQAVKDGHRATALRQATKIADALSRGTPMQRDGVLRSFYAFHLRETAGDFPSGIEQYQFPPGYAINGKRERGENTWLDGYKFAATFDPASAGTGVLGRIGNDTEPPTFYEDSGPILAAGLNRVLELEPGRTLSVLRVLRATKGVPLDGSFSSHLLVQAQQSQWATNREANQLFREVLPGKFTASADSIPVLAAALARGGGERLALAAAIVRADAKGELKNTSELLSAVQHRVSTGELSEADRPILLELLQATTELQPLAEVRTKLLRWSESGSESLRRQAMRTLLQGERFLLGTRARHEFEEDLNSAGPERLQDWLAAAAALDWKNSKLEAGRQLGLGIVTTALRNENEGVRRTAIKVAGSVPVLAQNPAVIESLQSLSQDAAGSVSEAAKAAIGSIKEHSSRPGEIPAIQPDFAYFVKHVQPIFQRTAADGDSCAKCHANHSILRLIPADSGQALSDEELRFNYLSALKVTNPASPEDSLLLIKPRSSFEGIGQPENYRKTHGGDVRWPTGKESPEYQAILRWVRGEKAPGDALSRVP